MQQFVIQRVHCLWTKQSRGGEGARQRNAVPTAVHLPRIDSPTGFVLHTAIYSESNNFLQSDMLKTANDFVGLGLRDLEFLLDNESLRVRFVRDGYNAARPSPYPYRDVFALRLMDWGRVVYNGRYIDHCSGNWWYEKSTYNIGWLADCSADVFVATQPINTFVEIAKLK